MEISNPIKVFWNSIKDVPERIKRLIALSAADGALFLDENGNYQVVPFGDGAGEIAEGDKYLKLSGGVINGDVFIATSTPSTSTTTGAFICSGGIGVNGTIYCLDISLGNNLRIDSNPVLIENSLGNFFIRNNGDNIYLQVFSGNRNIIFQGKDTNGSNIQIAKFNRDSIDLNRPVNISNGASGAINLPDNTTLTFTNGICTSIS